MNNQTLSSMCLLANPTKTSAYIRVWQIGAFIFPMIGLPGHILMIVTILNSERRRLHPTSLYYIFIAISESIYLLFLFWDWLDAMNLAVDPRKLLDCAFFYPFVDASTFISIVLVVQLNLDRIRMISHPQATQPHVTHKRILRNILLTCSTSILFFVNYRFSLYYDPHGFSIYGQSCRAYDRAHVWFYLIWPFVHILCRFIPSSVIILCTVYVCCNRSRHDSQPTPAPKHSIHRQQRKFSLVLVFLSIYIFCAMLPVTVIQLFNYHIWQYERDTVRHSCRASTEKANHWKLLNALFIMCEASIYTNKFYIRLIFSSKFRHDVKLVLCCQSQYQLSSVPRSSL